MNHILYIGVADFSPANSKIYSNIFTVKYLKSSIELSGGYLILDLSEGGGLIERGLNREGGLFKRSSGMYIFGSCSVLLPQNILRNQHTILRFKYINSTQFLSQTISNFTCKVMSLSKWKVFGKL